MKSICGINCEECSFKEGCKGCCETSGCPFGEECFIAQYIKENGSDAYAEYVKTLLNEINYLGVPDLPEVTNLNAIKGSFANLEYTLSNGQKIKLLNDNKIYLGTQLHKEETRRKTKAINMEINSQMDGDYHCKHDCSGGAVYLYCSCSDLLFQSHQHTKRS